VLEIEIDRGMCMGAGECVHHAPATFALGPDNRSTVVDAAGDDEDKVLGAAAACPNFAISVRRDGAQVL
jgi:ferredoxin